MALGDILFFKDPSFGAIGSSTRQVASGTTASINAGEFVLVALGSATVTAWTAGSAAKPVVATDFVAGLAMTTSTETASAAGTVEVMPLVPGQQFLIKPLVAATFGQGTTPSQSTYNALVGDRVLLNCSAGGVQTLLAVDGATNGFVIQDLDISKYPAVVAIAPRNGLSQLT